MCATKWDPHGPGSCEQKAPGMNKTFWFEYTLYLVRTVLVWITFLILWKFDEVQVRMPTPRASHHASFVEQLLSAHYPPIPTITRRPSRRTARP